MPDESVPPDHANRETIASPVRLAPVPTSAKSGRATPGHGKSGGATPGHGKSGGATPGHGKSGRATPGGAAPSSERLDSFIAGLPKAELHVHHVGSASPRVVAELAARHAGATPVPADPEALADYFAFTDFKHFINVYVTVVDLVRTADDVYALTRDVARTLAEQRVRYAELTVTPYSTVIRGVPAQEFCAAIEHARVRAEAEDGLVLRWCFDTPAELGPPAAAATLEIALAEQPAGLVSFGLGGAEVGAPRAQFAPQFARARAVGLRSAPHAGESVGPHAVWEAIDRLGAERIGHGIAAARDRRLLAELRKRQIALEVCPTSNVCTRAVASLAEHPLPALVAAGVPVSINSDDPSMFSTTINGEYAVAAELLGLDEAGVAELARAAVRQSFLADAGKASLLAEIDAYCCGRAGPR